MVDKGGEIDADVPGLGVHIREVVDLRRVVCGAVGVG